MNEEFITVKRYIKLNEGLRLKPYKCTAGKLSIGFGRNLDDKGISESEAEILLTNDIEDCLDSLRNIFNNFEHYYLSENRSLSKNRQLVLVDMMFNLGKTRFLKFKKMIKAVKDEDFEEAAKQILDSRYATQVPNRAKRNIDLMREG